MPYKCNVCNKIYLEGSADLKEVMLRGSCECGKKFLMYIRKGRIEDVELPETPEEKIMGSKGPDELGVQVAGTHDAEVKPEAAEPAKEPAENRIEDRLSWLGELVRMRKIEKPLHLSIETIKIIEEGKYQIDVPSLMQGKPVVVKDKDGVYYIDIPYAMKKKRDVGWI